MQVIDPPRNADEAWIVDDGAQVRATGRHRHAGSRHLRGPSRTRSPPAPPSQRAWSRCPPACCKAWTRDEVEAVIGHEVAHIANGDMVTMTLIQGVMNTFVVFLSRVIGYLVDGRSVAVRRAPRPRHRLLITTIVLDILFGFARPPSIVAWFSRQREFRADAGRREGWPVGKRWLARWNRSGAATARSSTLAAKRWRRSESTATARR